MATSKTLTPTNVTIQIPAFTDKPDQRVNTNCIDKEADAINALDSKIANLLNLDISYNQNYTTVQARIQKAIDDNAFTDSKTHIGSLSIGASGMYVLYMYSAGGKWYGSGFAAVSSSHYKLIISNSTVTATLI